MKKAFILAACILSTSALAQVNNSYKFISLGFGNNSYLPDSKQINYSSAWTPSIAAGIGYHSNINENYSLDSELSIDYSRVNFSNQTNNISNFDFSHEQNNTASFNEQGQVAGIGLWATARLKRNNLFSTSFAEVSPFVEMSVGNINLNYKTDNFNNFNNFEQATHNANHHDRVTAYKISAGLTFELEHGNSFSLSLGVGDTTNL